MHIIVIGAGEVGTHIVETLVEEGHDVVLIERAPARAAHARERIDALVLDGNGASPQLLKEARINKASLLVAVTDNDDSNLIACMAARSLGRDDMKTVARVRDLTYFAGTSSMMRGALGIDMVISPDRTTADDIANALLLPGAVTVERFANGKVTVAEVIVDDDSPALGRTFGGLRAADDTAVAGFTRDGRISIAYDDTTVKLGDHMFVVSDSANTHRIVGNLAGNPLVNRRVMVFGATKVGMHVARRLAKARRAVALIESNPEQATFAADRLDDVLVLHADGTDRSVLKDEGIEDTDAFVAASYDDAANLLTALTARQLGARSAFSVVTRSGYLPLVDVMGIDAVFSPRMHTADAILRFVRKGRVRRLHHFTTGAEMLEFSIDSECAATRSPLRDLGLPHDCVVSAIVRNGDVTYPRGDATVTVNDSVIVLAQPDAIDDVERVFAPA